MTSNSRSIEIIFVVFIVFSIYIASINQVFASSVNLSNLCILSLNCGGEQRSPGPQGPAGEPCPHRNTASLGGGDDVMVDNPSNLIWKPYLCSLTFQIPILIFFKSITFICGQIWIPVIKDVSICYFCFSLIGIIFISEL